MTCRKHALIHVAYALLGMACFGLVWFSDSVNDLYEQEPTWVIARYSEPWRSIAAVVVMGGGFVAAWRESVRRRTKVGAASWFALTAGIGLLVALELGASVFYEVTTGRIYVGTLLGRRVDIDLPANEDGVCVRADLGLVRWTVNGKEFYPRLLPLPLSSEALEELLRRPLPPGCARFFESD